MQCRRFHDDGFQDSRSVSPRGFVGRDSGIKWQITRRPDPDQRLSFPLLDEREREREREMGSPWDLNLGYRPTAKKNNAGILPNEFVGSEESGLEECLRCLEEEKRKIDAFKRELPLCMQLVNEAIENVKQQMNRKCKGNRSTLEEYLPMKELSSGEGRKEDGPSDEEKDYKEKMHCVRSAQLWRDNHVYFDPGNERTEEESFPTENLKRKSVNPCRRASLQLKGTSDVSVDLSLSTETRPSCGVPLSSPVQSGAQSQLQRKIRRCWSPELHRRFVNALQQLGGTQVATPKQIREFMKIDGLTNDEVKSHLQKYRLHTRRTGVSSHSPADGQQVNQLALRGMWVPHEYSSSDRSQNRHGLKQSPASSASPQGPFQLVGSQRATNDNLEDDDDDDEETKSESYSWKGGRWRSISEEITE